MAISDAIFDLSDLCDRSGVTARTVRYYIQQGLLPSPGQTGPGAKYGQGHLDRLRLIRKLQREHLPLAEIRRQLEGLADHEVASVLDKETAEPDSALDYIRGVLSEPPAAYSASAPRVSRKARARPSTGASFPKERAQWERFILADDVELHIRRPLSREMNRRVERLIEAARRILADDT